MNDINIFYVWLSGFIIGAVIFSFIGWIDKGQKDSRDDIVYALRYLVKLKMYKDKNGKNAWYAARVNIAWDQARRALNMESGK